MGPVTEPDTEAVRSTLETGAIPEKGEIESVTERVGDGGGGDGGACVVAEAVDE